jgi:Ankyrin repeats (3 copies)/Ankyrin repeat
MSDAYENIEILDSTLSVFELNDTDEKAIDLETVMGMAALSTHRQQLISALVESHGLGTVEYIIDTLMIEPHDAITYHEILHDLLESSVTVRRRVMVKLPSASDLGYDQKRIVELWSEWWMKNGSNRKYRSLAWREHSPRLLLALRALNGRDADEMERLVDHEDPVVRLALARNANITSEIRKLLACDPETIVRVTLAENENVDVATLHLLADDQNSLVRRWVAGNERGDRALFDKLKSDASKDVRSFLAGNRQCPRDVLEQLAKSDIREVAEKAQERLASASRPRSAVDALPSVGRDLSIESVPPSAEEVEAICIAAKRGDAGLVKQLLEQNHQLSTAKGRDGNTALHLAVTLPYTEGHLKTVELLIAEGADVNARDREGSTPLHWVACRPQVFGLQIAEMLLEHGADPDAESDRGNTPRETALRWASVFGENMRKLMDRGVK